MNMAFYYYFFNHSSRQTWCSVMVCFDASGPGWLVVTDRNMNSAPDQKILECQAIILCSELLGLSRRTKIWNTPTSPPLIGSKIKKKKFCSGLVKVRTLTWLRCFGRTINRTFILVLSNVATIRVRQYPPQRCERLIASYHKHLNLVLAAADGTTSH